MSALDYVTSRSDSEDGPAPTDRREESVGSFRALVYESLPADPESAGIVANRELFDRIQRRRERGLVGAIPIDELIDSLPDEGQDG